MPAQNTKLATSLLSQAAFCLLVVGAVQAEQGRSSSANSARRIVHHFDFDERDEGNLEELPRHWSALYGEGFPRFTRGSFDDSVGHALAPSFHIESLGRNVAFQYDGPEIPVRSESEYRMEGFIRTRGLHHARVCVSAHFLDAERRPLLATSRRTSYIAQHGEDWTHFELQLPAAPEGAAFFGLAAWILQDATWNLEQVGQGISLVDVGAEAWLDDVSVYRLPHVEIATRKPGNILEASEAALWVTLADSLDPDVAGELTVVSADGTEVMRRRHRSMVESARAERVDVSSLSPGLYDARIKVEEQGRTIVSRSVQFLQQAPTASGAARNSRSFGLVLDPANRADLRTESALLTGHSARSVKIPVWSAAGRPGMQAKAIGSDLEQYYQELVRSQFSLTAVLSLPEARPTAHPTRSSSDARAEAPATGIDMEFKAANLVGPASNVVRMWQIGSDGQSAIDDLNSFSSIEARLRTVLQDYNATPRIAIPMSVHDELNTLAPSIKQVTLAVNSGSDLWHLTEIIGELRAKGVVEISVFAPSLSAERFARGPRLAEWARRVLAARHAGADVVYVPQPWTVGNSEHESIVEPQEEYLLFKTIGGVLGDAKPGPMVAITEHVRCLTFWGETGSIVAMWDEAPPPDGCKVAIQLGKTSRQVDLWGNFTPLLHDAIGRSIVTVSAMPVLIVPVDDDAIEFASSVSFEPAEVESGTELVNHEIVINCSAALPESGDGILIPPVGIEVSPRAFSFTACAGEPVRIPVQVRYAHNEPAGKKKVMARIALSKSGYQFEIPMTVDLRMSDMEVSGRAILEGDCLLLRHNVQNKSQSVVSFRSVAGVPGRQRQYRPIPDLQPGETQTVEYRFPDASRLIGRKVNLALRELNDGPRQHNLELVVP